MIRRVTFAALLLGSCTQTTELIPPAPGGDAPCAMAIDVFGGANAQLSACGGPAEAPTPIERGLYAPGTPAYEATLAGRLRALLRADPELVARFGAVWKVRSCAGSGQTLSSLAPALPTEGCGAPHAPPAMGRSVSACSEDPAPIVLLIASGEDDGCHGGGAGSPYADDKAAYAEHLASRLAAFLDARRPRLALVGPRTEWYAAPVPPQQAPGRPELAACAWKRGGWDESGLRRWQDQHPAQQGVALFGHLHDEYTQHHPCCRLLDVLCAEGWFASDGSSDNLLNCDGVPALVSFWFTRMKKTLLQQPAGCP